MYQIYVPAFLIVVISWVPFWLDQEDNHARVGLGVTTVLTMTTLTTSTNASLPKISYIKAIDIYLFMCFLMVFLSLIEYATVGFFESKRQCKLSKIETESDLYKCENLNNNNDLNLTTISQQLNKKKNKHNYNRIKREEDSFWIDKLSRLVFPTVFILFNLIYASVFLFIIEQWLFIIDDNCDDRYIWQTINLCYLCICRMIKTILLYKYIVKV